MSDPGFSEAFRKTVDVIGGILDDLDDFGTPKVKLPNCPKCGEDELGVIHAHLCLCYRCGWRVEGIRPYASK